MIIGIDANEANVTNRVGIGQYAHQILLNLNKLDKSNKYIIFLKDQPKKDLPPSSVNWQYRVFGPKKFWTKIVLPIKLFTGHPRPDIFFSLGHYSPQFCPCPTIPSIMDLGYLKYPAQLTKKDLYQLTAWTAQSIKKAYYVVTISQFTKQEITKKYNINPNKIIVAPPSSTPPKNINNIKQTLKKFDIHTPYFLYLGTLKPSKNISFLIKSFAVFSKSNPNYQLVIAGKKGWLFNNIFTTIKNLNISDNIIFTDFISDNQKWALYKQATALIIPSLYEGFGMPALEAMSVGTPVIASNIASLSEIIGDSGLLINPSKKKDLIRALIKLTNPKTRQMLSQASLKKSHQFSWQKSAQTIISLFQKLSQTC